MEITKLKLALASKNTYGESRAIIEKIEENKYPTITAKSYQASSTFLTNSLQILTNNPSKNSTPYEYYLLNSFLKTAQFSEMNKQSSLFRAKFSQCLKHKSSVSITSKTSTILDKIIITNKAIFLKNRTFKRQEQSIRVWSQWIPSEEFRFVQVYKNLLNKGIIFSSENKFYKYHEKQKFDKKYKVEFFMESDYQDFQQNSIPLENQIFIKFKELQNYKSQIEHILPIQKDMTQLLKIKPIMMKFQKFHKEESDKLIRKCQKQQQLELIDQIYRQRKQAEQIVNQYKGICSNSSPYQSFYLKFTRDPHAYKLNIETVDVRKDLKQNLLQKSKKTLYCNSPLNTGRKDHSRFNNLEKFNMQANNNNLKQRDWQQLSKKKENDYIREIQKLKKKAEIFDQRFKNMNQKLNQEYKQKNQIEDQVVTLRKKNLELSRCLEKIQSQKKKYQKEITEENQIVKNLKNEYSQLKDLYNSLMKEKEMDQMSQTRKEMKEGWELNQLREQNNILKLQNKELKNNFCLLKNQINELEQFRELNQKNNINSKQINQCYKQAKNKIKQLETKLKNMEYQIKILNYELHKQKQKNHKEFADCDQIKRLQIEMDNKKLLQLKLEKENEFIKLRLEDYKKELNHKDSKLNQLMMIFKDKNTFHDDFLPKNLIPNVKNTKKIQPSLKIDTNFASPVSHKKIIKKTKFDIRDSFYYQQLLLKQKFHFKRACIFHKQLLFKKSQLQIGIIFNQINQKELIIDFFIANQSVVNNICNLKFQISSIQGIKIELSSGFQDILGVGQQKKIQAKIKRTNPLFGITIATISYDKFHKEEHIQSKSLCLIIPITLNRFMIFHELNYNKFQKSMNKEITREFVFQKGLYSNLDNFLNIFKLAIFKQNKMMICLAQDPFSQIKLMVSMSMQKQNMQIKIKFEPICQHEQFAMFFIDTLRFICQKQR